VRAAERIRVVRAVKNKLILEYGDRDVASENFVEEWGTGQVGSQANDMTAGGSFKPH